MRTRVTQFFPVLAALILFGATEVSAQTATVVTHSGQRIKGQLLSLGTNYGNTNNRNGNRNGNYGNGNGNYGNGNGNYGNSGSYDDMVVVSVAGRNQQIPVQDVAFLDFVGNGNVSQSELNRGSQSFDGLVVLRNGRTLTGRMVDLQGYNNQAVVSGQSGDQTVPLNQVARVYFGSNTTASTYDPYYNPNQNAYGNQGNNTQYGQYGQNNQYGQTYGNGRTVTIQTNQAWSNSGIDVRRGEVIHFRASGNTTLSQNPGDEGTPAGANDRRMAGNSPLRGVTGGLLIGRVGNDAPFAIGAESDVTMPANGRLYLGVNDDDVRDNTGSFVVEMYSR